MANSPYFFEANRTANQSAAIARGDANTAAQAAIRAKLEAERTAIRARGDKLSDAAAIASLTLRLKKSEAQLAEKEAAINEKNLRIAERDRIIKEWMHSNDTFKALARNYGRKLGLSDDDRMSDYLDEVLNQAEVNPEFEGTELGTKVRAKLGS